MLNIGIPQVLWMFLVVLGMRTAVANHNCEVKNPSPRLSSTLIAFAVVLGLYYWGGFFDKGFYWQQAYVLVGMFLWLGTKITALFADSRPATVKKNAFRAILADIPNIFALITGGFFGPQWLTFTPL